ncbi:MULTISPECIES: hypothetical protein [unclassified Leifsonia]|uniref:hypothetical protein n=1 Tax=unclassified Leifsonia TaxID=2663824 RepID=UPI00117B4DB6|nr:MULTISPECIES: hypothetical protein [unclassified Leifsonia]QJA00190.1 hypothetical protein HF024_17875 [Leifsonia sp. PS1209]
MKTSLIGLALALVGTVSALWSGTTLFESGVDADLNGTAAQLNPFVIAAFVAGLCAACVGLVLAVYGMSKHSSSRHPGGNRQN